jgi:hypothetical protein
MTRVSVPGVVDALLVKDPALVRSLAADTRLDRAYVPRGRLVNRILLGRLRRVLQLGGHPLPPVAERGPVRPTAAQAALEDRLNALAAGEIAGDEVTALAKYVQGAGRKGDAGRLAQQAVGRLFSAAYQADAGSWADAKVLGAAPSNLNPITGVVWAVTGRVARARKQLAAKVGGDPSGLHGTGVAIHNLSDAFLRMRQLYSDTRGHPPESEASAVGNTLGAPRQVLRQPTCRMEIEAGQLEPETLVILQLDAANAAAPGYDLVFMQDEWSRCPAHRWVPALLAAVWRRAQGNNGQ